MTAFSPSISASGIPALGSEATTLLTQLDGVFSAAAAQVGAVPMITPPLLPVDRLAGLDYYQNFPHQAMVATSLLLDGPDKDYQPSADSFPTQALEPARLALPAAACYGVYLHLAGQSLESSMRVTVMGRCFRKEENYEELRRLLGFHMREVVAIGEQEFAEDHLREFTERLTAYAAKLDLPLTREAAADPFFDKGGSRALLAKLAPVKYEFIYEGLAIASVNTHRNFFGERCDITLDRSGAPVFTSCVAFGLERWLSALTQRHGSWEAATHAVIAAGPL
jgi:hypothetical protein